MKNIKVKITSLLLLCAMLTSFAACSSDSTDAGETTAADTVNDTAVETTAADAETSLPIPDVSGMNLDGASFGMLYFSNELSHGWSGIPTDMNPTETSGDILNDAVYERNRKVEEDVNIVITEYPQKGHAAVFSEAQKTVMSGDDTYDIVCQSMQALGALVSGDLLRDMNKMQINTDAPWYNQKCIEELTIDGKLLFACSDITYIDKLSTIVTFFNKDIAADYSMEDFYKTVDDGKWTYDYMLKCAEQISKDVNGDGVMDKNDAYGISCQNDGSYYLLHSAGLRVGNKTSSGLEFAANNERFISTLQEIFDLMASELYFNNQANGVSIADTIALFVDNRDLFLIRPIQSVFNMRDMKADFGIIPMPRFFEDDDEYHSPTNIYPGVIMCVPKNTKNADYIGTVIDYLAAESHVSVMPVFYDVVLDSKLTRDDIASRMLDIVFDSRVYDLGLMWDIGGLRTAIVTKEHLNVASTIASLTSKAETEIGELYKAFENVKG